MEHKPGAVLETDADWAAQEMDLGQDAEWAGTDEDEDWASKLIQPREIPGFKLNSTTCTLPSKNWQSG